MRWLIAGGLRGAWPPIVVFALHVAFSRVVDLYSAWPLLDDVMHTAGGMAIAWFFTCVARAAGEAGALRAEAFVFGVLVLALTCAAAMFWEFTEFVSDRYMGTHAQGDLHDTLLDMCLGFAGGCLLLAALHLAGKPARA